MCPAGSIVGRGEATVFFPVPNPDPAIPQSRRWELTAVNGGDRILVVWRRADLPARRNALTTDGRVRSAPAGLFVGWTGPSGLVSPSANTVTSFRLSLGASIRRDGRRRGLFEITRCTNGRFRAIGGLLLTDQALTHSIRLPLPASVTCRG